MIQAGCQFAADYSSIIALIDVQTIVCGIVMHVRGTMKFTVGVGRLTASWNQSPEFCCHQHSAPVVDWIIGSSFTALVGKVLLWLFLKGLCTVHFYLFSTPNDLHNLYLGTAIPVTFPLVTRWLTKLAYNHSNQMTKQHS